MQINNQNQSKDRKMSQSNIFKERQTKMTLKRYNIWRSRMKHHNNQSITDYFNITPSKNSSEKLQINMSLSKSMKYCVMTLYYTNTPKYSVRELPEEINTIIYQYYKEYFVFQFKIDYSDYPFRPPKWSLYSFQYHFSSEYDKMQTNMIVEAYCKGILRCHNCQNELDWSPAIMIQADVLSFYMLINNFRNLINKLKTKNTFNP